jgi:hypothetical protein
MVLSESLKAVKAQGWEERSVQTPGCPGAEGMRDCVSIITFCCEEMLAFTLRGTLGGVENEDFFFFLSFFFFFFFRYWGLN